MPTYCTTDKLNTYLPDSLPAAVSGKQATDIADASEVVDAKVGGRFGLNYNSNTQRFPEVTDDPATPAIIQQATALLAAGVQYQRLKERVGDGEVSMAEVYRKRGEAILEQVKSGEIEIVLSGSSIGSSVLGSVEDPIYADRVDPKEFMNVDDIEAHQ